MSDDDQNVAALGQKTSIWMVRGFSNTLRAEISRLARQADCTVAEWLHAHFHKHGLVEIDIPDQPRPSAGPPPASDTTAAAVATLVDAACRLAAAKGLRRHVRAAAEAAIVQGLDIYVDLALPPRRPAISAPEKSP